MRQLRLSQASRLVAGSDALPWPSTPYASLMQRRFQRFVEEKQRQAKNRPKIEKIRVFVEHKTGGKVENVELSMNRFVSTPYDCAKHISSLIADRAVLAVENRNLTEQDAAAAQTRPQTFGMHEPLTENTQLRFLQYTDRDTRIVNQCFWQSCSFLLSVCAPALFKSNIRAEVLPLPLTKPTDGSFACDIRLLADGDNNLVDWQPSTAELEVMSRSVRSLIASANAQLQPLRVSHQKAAEILEPNDLESRQLSLIPGSLDAEAALVASTADDWYADKPVQLYSCGRLVSLAPASPRRPLIAATQHVYRFAVTAAHALDSPYGRVLRLQGCALPNVLGLRVNSYTWQLLCKHSQTLNSAPVRFLDEVEEDGDDDVNQAAEA